MVMEKYYFLFGIALIWIVAASVQDIRKREVPNWINFSLIAFALAYRAFYASVFGNWNFFLFGILGFGVFFVLANVFYYTRTFAGGDAKLLMGIGAVLPFESLWGLVFEGIGFLFVLFVVGAAYSFIYSLVLAINSGKKFLDGFWREARRSKWLLIWGFVLGILFLFLTEESIFRVWLFLFFFIVPGLYVFLAAVDKTCMIKLMKPGELSEGDWLEREVRVRGKIIKKSIHGLSIEDIKLLRKAKKSAWIKQGVPFIPAFLISWAVMVFFYLVLGLDFLRLFSSLSL